MAGKGQEMTGGGREAELNQITERIIGCAYTVANTLGCGFLEKVYDNALAHELRKSGMAVEPQYAVPVHYDGRRGWRLCGRPPG